MLFALILGGLAAAAAAPVLLSSGDEDTDDALAEPEAERSDLPDLETGEDASGQQGAPDEGSSEAQVLPEGPGAYEIDAFDPEEDALVVPITDIDVNVETGWDEDGHPYFRTETPDGELSVRFSELETVPLDAITFAIADGAGGDALRLTLGDIIERGGAGEDGPQSRTDFLDWVDDDAWKPYDLPLDDLGDLSPVLPEPGDLADAAAGASVEDLHPVAPGTGDATDRVTPPSDDLAPLAPVDPDRVTDASGLGSDSAATAPVRGDATD